MLTCVWNKQQNAYGRKMKVLCGKQAQFTREDGTPLCEHHFKRWWRKTYKHNSSEKLLAEVIAQAKVSA